MNVNRELFETLLIPKPQRQAAGHLTDHEQLAQLLVAKDKELKAYLKMAAEQEEIQVKTDLLEAEVDKQDEQIRQLQKHLKDAEHILATAIYQAKQKLSIISKASERHLPSEELIKYAHRISSSHSVAAPFNWEVGDPRRPYPTDIEMRSGLLGQIPNPESHGPAPPNASPAHPSPQHQTQAHQSPYHQAGGPVGPDLPARPSSTASTSSGSNFPWGQQDIKPNLSGMAPGLPPDLRPGTATGKNDSNLEDVEVMSTDSSSSSSSDSQWSYRNQKIYLILNTIISISSGELQHFRNMRCKKAHDHNHWWPWYPHNRWNQAWVQRWQKDLLVWCFDSRSLDSSDCIF